MSMYYFCLRDHLDINDIEGMDLPDMMPFASMPQRSLAS
jgi:hypothetical protein